MTSARSTAARRIWVFAGGWPRRALAVLLLILGLLLLLAPQPHSGAGGPFQTVVVAAKPLQTGTQLTPADLRLARWPTAVIPDHTFSRLDNLAHKMIAGPVGAGEPLTPERLLSTAITAGLHAGEVAVTITLPTSAQIAILQAGQRVDIYLASDSAAETSASAGPSPGTAGAIAADVAILAILSSHGTDPAAAGAEPASLVIACDRLAAGRIARSGTGPFLATLRSPS